MLRLILMQRSGPGPLDLLFTRLVPLLAVLLLNGCSSAAYYGQLAEGQWQLLRARQPVEQVVADPATSAQLRARLEHASQARVFASQQLKLPDNRSYRVYADIGRPYVVWNVFATPELSLQPVTHCFPIAGCVAYRGYYQQGAARGAAALMRQEGMDAYVGGVEAYSTLGWFDDPILSSMVGWSEERLATLIFHELAHQRFYVQDDTEFNESFASFVEQEGTRQWRVARGLAAVGGSRGSSVSSSSAWCWPAASGCRRYMPGLWMMCRSGRPSRRSLSACGVNTGSCGMASGVATSVMTPGCMGR